MVLGIAQWMESKLPAVDKAAPLLIALLHVPEEGHLPYGKNQDRKNITQVHP